jgi:hypothetical protein
MAVAPREELTRVLEQAAPEASSSIGLRAKASGLQLDVVGIGQVKLPVSAAQAARLCALGRPARFGRGERTLTDRKVRDTWEMPKELVTLQWSPAFESRLDAVRDGLGLPPAQPAHRGPALGAGVRAGAVLRRAPGLREGRRDGRHPGGGAAVLAFRRRARRPSGRAGHDLPGVQDRDRHGGLLRGLQARGAAGDLGLPDRVPGCPDRPARTTTGRSRCPPTAAATCATTSARSCGTGAGPPWTGRSPRHADSTSTTGSNAPNCPSRTRRDAREAPTSSS